MRCSLTTAAALLGAAGSIAAVVSSASAQSPAAAADPGVAGPARASLRGSGSQVPMFTAAQAENAAVPNVGAPTPQSPGFRAVPIEAVPNDAVNSPALETGPSELDRSLAEDPEAAKLPGRLETAAMIGPMRDAVQTFSSMELKDDWRYYVNVVPMGPRPIETGEFWPPYAYTWQSPAFYYRPLYFEQPNLERYGQGTYRVLQPAVSAAHFFATAPLLPVKALIDHPLDRTYSLGHHRPGNSAPVQRNVFWEN